MSYKSINGGMIRDKSVQHFKLGGAYKSKYNGTYKCSMCKNKYKKYNKSNKSNKSKKSNKSNRYKKHNRSKKK